MYYVYVYITFNELQKRFHYTYTAPNCLNELWSEKLKFKHPISKYLCQIFTNIQILCYEIYCRLLEIIFYCVYNKYVSHSLIFENQTNSDDKSET